MVSNSSDHTQKSLQIKQEDKFYSKLLSMDSSVANPSFRVYYGVASGAVPFVWESQPGTPKNSIPTATLPPLTPPPSYFSPNNKRGTKKSLKSTIIHTILPRLSLWKAHTLCFIMRHGSADRVKGWCSIVKNTLYRHGSGQGTAA